MKLTKPAIGVLSTIALLVSVGAIYSISFESALSNQSSGPIGAAFLTGNVKVTHFDPSGQVIGYRQGTNHITATGMAIIMGQVFTGVNETMHDGYDPGYPSPWRAVPGFTNMSGTVGYMEIGTGGDQDGPAAEDYINRLRWNNTDIIAPVLGAAKPLCVRQNADIDNSTQLEAHTAPNRCNFDTTHPAGHNGDAAVLCAAQMNVTATSQFAGDDCDVNGIDEAGIFTHQDGSEGLMFARNTFGSVNLMMGDTLQLEWEFTFKDSL